MKGQRQARLLTLLVMLLILVRPAGAQTVTATLSGQVTDTSGGIIRRATITALNSATTFSRSTQMNDTLLPAWG